MMVQFYSLISSEDDMILVDLEIAFFISYSPAKHLIDNLVCLLKIFMIIVITFAVLVQNISLHRF